MLLNVSSKTDPALCPKGCGVSFRGTNRKQNLKKHMIYTCDVSPKFQCKLCQKKFKHKQSWKYHIFSVHGITNIYEN
jgi:hypothetical protein